MGGRGGRACTRININSHKIVKRTHASLCSPLSLSRSLSCSMTRTVLGSGVFKIAHDALHVPAILLQEMHQRPRHARIHVGLRGKLKVENVNGNLSRPLLVRQPAVQVVQVCQVVLNVFALGRDAAFVRTEK